MDLKSRVTTKFWLWILIRWRVTGERMMNLDIVSSLIYVYCPILCFILSLDSKPLSSIPDYRLYPSSPLSPTSRCVVFLRWLVFQEVPNKIWDRISGNEICWLLLTCLSNSLYNWDSRSFVFLQVSLNYDTHSGEMSPDLMGPIAYHYIRWQ